MKMRMGVFFRRFVQKTSVTFAVVLVASLPFGAARSQSDTKLKDVTASEIQGLEAEKANRTPAQEKIGSQILEALKQQSNGGVNVSVPGLRISKSDAAKKGALVDIDAAVTSSLLDSIRKAGGTIINSHPDDHAIRAYVPLDKMEGIAARPEINSISPAAKATTNAIRFNDEGKKAHASDAARSAFSVTGKGIKIGVLSDSIDNAEGALRSAFSSGAMSKARLKILAGQEGRGEGEGLAMAEIIHAIAPDASIIFASGLDGPAQMADNIRALRKEGCQIIVDDITYFNESPFQDGPIARAVNEVSAAGVLYFSSARNSGSKKHGTSGTWEGDFADGGPATGDVAGNNPHRLHVFSGSLTVNKVLQASSRDRVDLFWADPLGRSANDYNLYVVDADGHVLRSSTTSHKGTQDPYQSVSGLNEGELIVITKEATAASLFLHLDAGRAVLSETTEGNVRGHNASGAPNAFSVAAIRAPNPVGEFEPGTHVTVEPFSSDGPRRMFFRADGTAHTPGDFSSKGGLVLDKPDVTAADGVSTSLPKGSALNPFFGTSAAAPHAAAIAALLLSYDPTLSPADVRKILVDTAMGIEGGGRNINSGAGIVMPFAALRMACIRKKSSCPAQAVARRPGSAPENTNSRINATR